MASSQKIRQAHLPYSNSNSIYFSPILPIVQELFVNRVIISTILILLWGCSGDAPFEATTAEHPTTQSQPQSTQLSANTQPAALQSQPKTPSLTQSTEPQLKITTNPIYDQPRRKVVVRLNLTLPSPQPPIITVTPLATSPLTTHS